MPTEATPTRQRRSHAERSAATRRQLLQATAALVRERSFQAASMFEVAKAAGVTPGALQHHFGSKAELMMQVIEHVLQSDASDGVAWPAATLPLPQRARAFVQALWTSVYATPRFLTAWSIYFGSANDPALRERIGQRRHALSAALHRRCVGIFPELGSSASARAFVDLTLSSLRGIGVVRLFDPADDPSPLARPAASPSAATAATAATAAQLRELARLIEQRCTRAPTLPTRRPSR